MKTLLAFAVMGLLSAGSAAYAHEGDEGHEKNDPQHFQMMKEQMVKNLDEEIAMLQKAKECVSAATDHASMKKCREEREAAMKAKHQAMKAQRLQMIEEQKKHLEQEKQELEKTESK